MDTSSHRPLAFLSSALSGLRLLSIAEVKQAAWLTGAMVVGSVLEILSVAAVLPFVNVVVQPDSIRTNQWLGRLHRWAGAPNVGEFISLLGVGVIVLMVLSAIANWSILYAQNRYAAACQARLAKDLLDQCIHAPYSWFLGRNSAVLTRLLYDDVVIWSRSLVQRLMMMANSVITVAMAVALILAFSLGTGILVVAAVAILGWAAVYLTRPLLTRLAAIKRDSMDAMTLTATQALAGIKDIKLSSREGHFSDLFESAYASVTGAHARLNVWQETPSLTMQMLAQATLVTLAIVFWHMELGSGQIAMQIALLILVTTKVIPAVGRLSVGVTNLLGALPHVSAIQEVLASIEAETRRASRVRADARKLLGSWRRITFERAGYQYPNSQEWALRELNISFERGRVYGLVGRSAAGKSTLVDLLVGLLEPTEGGVCVDEDSLGALDLKAWQKRIGYVPQTPFVADDSLRANVAFGVRRLEVDDGWVRECLRLANLADLPDTLDQGLDTTLGERGLRLSGGQRQRVAIARALYNRPELLVFDEATSALDSISEGEILAALHNLRGRVTLIIVAHRLTTVAHCDRIFVLEEGRVVGQGTYADLNMNHALFRQMADGFVKQSELPLPT